MDLQNACAVQWVQYGVRYSYGFPFYMWTRSINNRQFLFGNINEYAPQSIFSGFFFFFFSSYLGSKISFHPTNIEAVAGLREWNRRSKLNVIAAQIWIHIFKMSRSKRLCREMIDSIASFTDFELVALRWFVVNCHMTIVIGFNWWASSPFNSAIQTISLASNGFPEYSINSDRNNAASSTRWK